MAKPTTLKESEVFSDFPQDLEFYFEPDPYYYMGLYYSVNKFTHEKELKTFYYVGLCWLKAHEHVLLVNPKIEKLDYLRIFLECLSNPIVAQHFDEVYEIFFNEPIVPFKAENIDITPLLIAHFLIMVKKICKKGLKKGYIKINENLSGQVKGKLDIKKNIYKNLNSNRQDRCYCNYQIHTIDCIENRILKSALNQIRRYVSRYYLDSTIKSMLNFNNPFFQSVTNVNIAITDFKNIKHSAFYPEYKQALKLALMIFKRLGFNPHNIEHLSNCTPPFFINMPELFERYVETKLRNENYQDLKVGYSRYNSETQSSSLGLRPDFLLPKKIIDAKYKPWYLNKTNVDFKEDFQQLSLYGRTKVIREKIEISEDEMPELIFIYPDINGDDKIELDKIEEEEEFRKFYKKGIKLPLKK